MVIEAPRGLLAHESSPSHVECVASALANLRPCVARRRLDDQLPPGPDAAMRATADTDDGMDAASPDPVAAVSTHRGVLPFLSRRQAGAGFLFIMGVSLLYLVCNSLGPALAIVHQGVLSLLVAVGSSCDMDMDVGHDRAAVSAHRMLRCGVQRRQAISQGGSAIQNSRMVIRDEQATFRC